MREETLRDRFYEIAKDHLDYEGSWSLPLGDPDVIRREILTLASKKNVSLGVDIHVEMIDMVLWFWENRFKLPKKSIMTLFNSYSLYTEGDYNIFGLVPEKGLTN